MLVQGGAFIVSGVGGPDRVGSVVLPPPSVPLQPSNPGDAGTPSEGMDKANAAATTPVVTPAHRSRRGDDNAPLADNLRRKGSHLTKEDIEELADRLNKVVDAMDIQARFSVHQATKRIMVKLINVKDHSVIREIPPEKLLDMVAQMLKFVGLLVDEKV